MAQNKQNAAFKDDREALAKRFGRFGKMEPPAGFPVVISQPELLMSQPATVSTAPAGTAHGASRLPSVIVEDYGVELKDEDGFIGDRANKGAFRELLGKWRGVLRRAGDDPLGDEDSETIAMKEIDKVLAEGDPEAAAAVQAAIEEFALEFAAVTRRFLKQKAWRETERIVVGGGFRGSRVGELAIGRASLLLKNEKIDIGLMPIRHAPDEAGLLGAVHLAPHWIFKGHDAILAADIGGSNIRAGVVQLNLKEDSRLSQASVWKYERWRHRDEKNVKRADAVEKLADMLTELIDRAGKEKLRMAPFIGIGCPGVIDADGTIERGSENLPGKWDAKTFNLPQALLEHIPKILDHDTVIVMHNDAVVQGLSERPFMDDVERWGVLTIGTGLGNAQFRNRGSEDD
jgi:predicted NBD/HSP70 family sugar kinase